MNTKEILIADDDKLIRTMLRDILNLSGWNVFCAKDGNEAWQMILQDGSPSLLILDWLMPGMNGIDICRKIRSQKTRKNYTYIILLTSKGRREDIISGLEAGVDDYIIKPFDPDQLKWRIRIGQRILELEKSITKIAHTDYLTGLMNRRAFLDRLDVEVNRAKREKNSLGIIIGDIDRFKKVNDTYGHLAGDVVLQEFAALILSLLRPYDFAGRFGGEEFIVCTPHTMLENTAVIAKRLRAAVEKKGILLPAIEKPVHITASFGVSALYGGAGEERETLIQRADSALYKAKENGRNMVWNSVPAP